MNPFDVFIIIILGYSIVRGLFRGLVKEASSIIGVLGGFTTFSSFSIETFSLVEQGSWGKAVANMSGSLVLCVGATWVGVLLGRQL